MLAAGINVAFGHDDIMDPWYPLGTGNPVQVAFVGAHATQLTGPAEIAECFRMVTDRAAAVLGLGAGYGIAPGRPASFMLLPASGPFDVVRRQVRPSHVVAHGQVVATTPASVTTLRWPGRGGGLHPAPRRGRCHLAVNAPRRGDGLSVPAPRRPCGVTGSGGWARLF